MIEDSFKTHSSSIVKKSVVLTCRNMFKTDEAVLNYELDSEEEWNEENGIDLDNQEGLKEDDDDESDDPED
jgi:hypothetical protein